MERYEDEALCRCGAWVSVAILRDNPRVQFSSSGVICLACRDMEVHVGYNWIARQVAFVRYMPLSVNTKRSPCLTAPPRLYVVKLRDDKKDAIERTSRAPIPGRRRAVPPVR